MLFSRGAKFHHIFSPAFLIISIFIFGSCRSASLPSESPQSSEDKLVLPEQENSPFPILSSNINLAKPLEISNRPEDVALCEKINRTIDESEFTNARWGVVAISLKDGRVACGRDARKLFNPASIQKTLTAIVALERLGADYRWRTSVYAQNQIEADGTLSGNLILYGQGAPDFDTQALEKLVGDLQAKGLKRVKGNVVGDESYFKGSRVGEGWTWNELQWYYGAEASALTFNENQGFVNVENGVGKTSTDYMQVATVAQPSPENNNANAVKGAGISRGLEDNNFYVWGTNKNWGARVAVYNPAGWAARAFKEALGKRGITVDGDAQSVDWKSENKLEPQKATELAFVESKTLGEIVQKMNKHSVNLYAELLLRTVGKRFGEGAPEEDMQMQEVRGDDTAGAAVVKKWLRDHNVATDEIQIHDGSGLSRLDFLSPEAFGRAFIYAAQSGFADAFTSSLPISGTDGTLGGRLSKVKGRVWAKTGTVTFVNSLAGYAQTTTGEAYAFAIICNNQTRKAEATTVIDKIATLVANGNEEEEKNGAKEMTNSAENNSKKEEKPK